jgi:hypothetical protein
MLPEGQAANVPSLNWVSSSGVPVVYAGVCRYLPMGIPQKDIPILRIATESVCPEHPANSVS